MQTQVSTVEEKIASACKEIMDLPPSYRDSANLLDDSSRHSAWSSSETIHAGLDNCTKAQKILTSKNFTASDNDRIAITIVMLKNRAESLSAESDGIPAIAALTATWAAWASGAIATTQQASHSLLLIVALAAASMGGLGLAVYFLCQRLSSRRKVAGLRELANHLELFCKSAVTNGAASSNTPSGGNAT